jgi:hypothetical protein
MSDKHDDPPHEMTLASGMRMRRGGHEPDIFTLWDEETWHHHVYDRSWNDDAP